MSATPSPGSPAAVAQGCECAVMDNAHGRGIPGSEKLLGGPHYYVTGGCPVHAPEPDEKAAA